MTNMLQGQDDNLRIKQVEGLSANSLWIDGGLTLLNLEIVKSKVNRNSGKIKIKGVVKGTDGEETPFFKIYKGYRDTLNRQLVITDTVYNYENVNKIRFNIFNRKKASDFWNGLFKVSTTLDENEKLYIYHITSHMIEIKINNE